MPRDPRWYQIAVLSGLLLYGMAILEFDVSAPRALVLLGSVLATQWALGRITGLPKFDPKSALISGLSLCLLLRTNSHLLAAAVAFATIASKFVLRVNGKHVFNPTNFGIVLALALGMPVWVSPGQWGHIAFFGFLMACLGTVVVTRAARADVTFGFLAAYAALVFGRAAWLGQPWANPIHQLQSGGLLLFSFFMISDPRTTPDRRAGRVLFALLVALGAAFVQFRLFRTNGLLWSLAVFAPTVPLIDWLLPAAPHRWPAEPLRRST
jgi:Na+-transporting NADH:ubiquinone oxidoreductase subunit NqrB